MKNIWAPWRMEYIKGPKNNSCVFCDALADDDPLILKRGSLVYAIMNRFPYTAGHCMVLPFRHVGDLSDLSKDETGEIMSLTRDITLAMRKAMSPDGFNIGCNIGASAGAGIAEHFHMHIVPRWTGDTNFMPVLDDARIISEHIMLTRNKICDNLT
ncbi:HIT domain-containing protein [bacterium]|nr:HIT domain-containing protein [bacterium]